MPPYLAGRDKEQREFLTLLEQATILQNLIVTGLRGVGKTVLLEAFKPLALRKGWYWVGTDMSESTSVSEKNMAIRLLADLSVGTSSIVVGGRDSTPIGFGRLPQTQIETLNYDGLIQIFEETPGLIADKLKSVLEIAWSFMRQDAAGGIVFAYDEAQNMGDDAVASEYPLSLLLDVFQSIQRKNIPFMLVLTGLPTLFPKLVEARTFSERMFDIWFLDRLSPEDSRDAILKPITQQKCPVAFSNDSVDTIIEITGGYPYFIQFICREVYDLFIQKTGSGVEPSVPVAEIERKLDTNFFAGRWSRATDRQRDLLGLAAGLESCDEEFTVHELVAASERELERPFSGSYISQLLSALSEVGLVYKKRHGKYAFAVPLLSRFIRRQLEIGS